MVSDSIPGNSTLYVTTLQLQDFKCFGHAKLTLQYPGRKTQGASEIPNVNVILGDNGGGKSSILRALALSALAWILPHSGFVPLRLVRRGAADTARPRSELKATLVVAKGELPSHGGVFKPRVELLAHLEPGKGSIDKLTPVATLTSQAVPRALDDDRSPSFFLVGYGATRRVETGDFSESSARRSRGLRYARVAGLFEEHVTLRPMHQWLAKLEAQRSPRVAEVFALLNAVLPPDVRFTGAFDAVDNQYLFESHGRQLPLASLSDGYQAFVGWIGDLLSHLCDVTPADTALTDLPGMVLVDEVDLHLHPQWQLSVVPTLARCFPKLQFVFTSHSPLVANTVKRENIFVTDVASDESATVKQLEEHVYGRGAEQLLLSSYFGLTTTRPSAFEAKSEKLFRQAANGDSGAALAFLKSLVPEAATSETATGRKQSIRGTAPRTVANKAGTALKSTSKGPKR